MAMHLIKRRVRTRTDVPPERHHRPAILSISAHPLFPARQTELTHRRRRDQDPPVLRRRRLRRPTPHTGTLRAPLGVGRRHITLPRRRDPAGWGRPAAGGGGEPGDDPAVHRVYLQEGLSSRAVDARLVWSRRGVPYCWSCSYD